MIYIKKRGCIGKRRCFTGLQGGLLCDRIKEKGGEEMPDMNFNFLLDGDTYKSAARGAHRFYGKMKKRIPKMLNSAKGTGEKTADFLGAHKTEVAIAGGVLAALGVAGVILVSTKRRTARKQERLLDSYLVGMKNGTLTPGFLAGFVTALEKGNRALVLTEKQLDTVYQFTVKLAAAHGIEANLTRDALDLKECLLVQKQALENMSE